MNSTSLRKSTRNGLLVGIVALFFALMAVYPRLVRREITVPFQRERIRPQFDSANSLRNWFLTPTVVQAEASKATEAGPEIRTGDWKLTLTNRRPDSYLYTLEKSGRSKTFLFHLLPHPDSPTASRISLTYKTRWLDRLTGHADLVGQAESSLQRLDSICNEPIALFGYPIRQIEVVDSAFLSMRKKVAKKTAREETRKMFEFLINVAERKKSDYTGVRIFHSYPVSADSLMLMAGIGINTPTPTDPSDPVQYKMMPYGKKLLALEYEGNYADAHRAYEILETYRQERQMTNIAIPFQKFLTEGYAFSDSQTVRLRVCIPVL